MATSNIPSPLKICACCAENKHISLCHNVTWSDAGEECECGCAPASASYRASGYVRQNLEHGPSCDHSEWFAPEKSSP